MKLLTYLERITALAHTTANVYSRVFATGLTLKVADETGFGLDSEEIELLLLTLSLY
jgi:hypothetical protein